MILAMMMILGLLALSVTDVIDPSEAESLFGDTPTDRDRTPAQSEETREEDTDLTDEEGDEAEADRDRDPGSEPGAAQSDATRAQVEKGPLDYLDKSKYPPEMHEWVDEANAELKGRNARFTQSMQQLSQERERLGPAEQLYAKIVELDPEGGQKIIEALDRIQHGEAPDTELPGFAAPQPQPQSEEEALAAFIESDPLMIRMSELWGEDGSELLDAEKVAIQAAWTSQIKDFRRDFRDAQREQVNQAQTTQQQYQTQLQSLQADPYLKPFVQDPANLRQAVQTAQAHGGDLTLIARGLGYEPAVKAARRAGYLEGRSVRESAARGDLDAGTSPTDLSAEAEPPAHLSTFREIEAWRREQGLLRGKRR